MSVREAFEVGLLAIGVAGFALNAVGLLVARDAYDQIHYLAPGSLLGCVAIPAALVVQEGFTQAGVKAILIALLLLLANPVLSHATARAARVRRKQTLRPRPGDDFLIAEEE
jgi:multicomponent Na+:H+ antiporter subunit G